MLTVETVDDPWLISSGSACNKSMCSHYCILSQVHILVVFTRMCLKICLHCTHYLKKKEEILGTRIYFIHLKLLSYVNTTYTIQQTEHSFCGDFDRALHRHLLLNSRIHLRTWENSRTNLFKLFWELCICKEIKLLSNIFFHFPFHFAISIIIL